MSYYKVYTNIDSMDTSLVSQHKSPYRALLSFWQCHRGNLTRIVKDGKDVTQYCKELYLKSKGL